MLMKTKEMKYRRGDRLHGNRKASDGVSAGEDRKGQVGVGSSAASAAQASDGKVCGYSQGRTADSASGSSLPALETAQFFFTEPEIVPHFVQQRLALRASPVGAA